MLQKPCFQLRKLIPVVKYNKGVWEGGGGGAASWCQAKGGTPLCVKWFGNRGGNGHYDTSKNYFKL